MEDCRSGGATQVDYNSGMSPIYTLMDGYDNAGNRTTREQNGNRWTWVYDAADQLLQQLRSGYRGTYTYDEVGNITLKDHQGYSPITMTFDAANRLATAQRGTTPVTLTYDAVGNLTVDNANGNRVTYAYAPENRLLSMHNYTGSRYTYAYWADGLRRYAQEPSSPIVTQIWDGQDLLMEKSPTGTARYIAHEGEVFGEKRGETRYLYLPDPLGSVVALLDNAQAITDSFIYLPYGEEQSRTGSTASNLRWLGRWGYRRDYTNRAYVRARAMRTDYGKRMTDDPLGFDAGDVNLYRYVAGNPMTEVDPSGRRPVGLGRRRARPSRDEHMCRVPKDWVFSPLPGEYVGWRPVWPWEGVLEYGTWCGYYVTSFPENQGIDCIDNACRRHDLCLDAANDWWGKGHYCHCALMREAVGCQYGGCSNARFPNQCREAAMLIAAAMTAICALTVLTRPGEGGGSSSCHGRVDPVPPCLRPPLERYLYFQT